MDAAIFSCMKVMEGFRKKIREEIGRELKYTEKKALTIRKKFSTLLPVRDD